MVPVANGGLRHLCDQSLGVAQQQSLNRARAMEFLFKNTRTQSICHTCTLHDRSVRRRFTAHKKRNADQPFIAHDRNLACAIWSR